MPVFMILIISFLVFLGIIFLNSELILNGRKLKSPKTDEEIKTKKRKKLIRKMKYENKKWIVLLFAMTSSSILLGVSISYGIQKTKKHVAKKEGKKIYYGENTELSDSTIEDYIRKYTTDFRYFPKMFVIMFKNGNNQYFKISDRQFKYYKYHYKKGGN